MRNLNLSFLLVLILAACATGDPRRDASAEADSVLGGAAEFKESRDAADQRLAAELRGDVEFDADRADQQGAGAFAESETGAGFLDEPAGDPGPGMAFYVYLGIAAILFGYIVWLLWDRSRHRHGYGVNEEHFVRVK